MFSNKPRVMLSVASRIDIHYHAQYKKNPLVDFCSLCQILRAIIPQSTCRARVQLNSHISTYQSPTMPTSQLGFMIQWTDTHTSKFCPPIYLLP
jgi:hypothetical protein